MLKIAIAAVVVLYVVGFVLVFLVSASGPATPALSLYRAAVWPISLATGWQPKGERLPMD